MSIRTLIEDAEYVLSNALGGLADRWSGARASTRRLVLLLLALVVVGLGLVRLVGGLTGGEGSKLTDDEQRLLDKALRGTKREYPGDDVLPWWHRRPGE